MASNSEKRFTIYDVVVIGFMAALVFVSSKLSIPIPTGIDNTRIHFGNIFCLLSGLLFGGLRGGLAAGFGSMFFDLTDPMYISSAWFTFLSKFVLGYVCGKLAYVKRNDGRNLKLNIGAAAVGQLAYLVLYLAYSYIKAVFFLQVAHETALITVGTKALTSGANAVIAVVIAVPLGFALKKALAFTGIYNKVMYRRKPKDNSELEETFINVKK